MSRRQDVGLVVFIGVCGVLGAGVGFGIKESMAQAVYTGTPAVLDGPMTVNGFVTMTNGLSVDGGVRTTDLRADTATVGSLDAGTLYAQSARFGTRPLGIFLPGDYARTTGLVLTTLGGWTSGGTLTVAGALVGDACDLVSWPAGLNILSVDYRCAVTGANTAEIQFKALVALTVPVGTYKVLISGPGQ